MDVVTVSSKYRVVIPHKARKALRIEPGQKMRVMFWDNQLILIPVRSITEARGSLKYLGTFIINKNSQTLTTAHCSLDTDD
jgi:AbrB family looped-hinge helix DNA binding protein